MAIASTDHRSTVRSTGLPLPARLPTGLWQVPIDDLRDHPDNPRISLKDIDDLAESIRDYGLQQPISVQPHPDGTFLILGGHRRAAAYRRNVVRYPDEHDRWSTIAAVIGQSSPMDGDNPLRSTLTLVAQQLHTQAWTEREEAAAFDQLHHKGLKVREIAIALNRSAGLVSKRRRVYDDDVLSAPVQAGLLSPGVAEELLVVASGSLRRELTKRAIAEDWRQHHARTAVRNLDPVRRSRNAIKLAKEFIEVLEGLHPDDFTKAQQSVLWTLHEQIVRIANRPVRGAPTKRIIPTMAQAEAAAKHKT